MTDAQQIQYDRFVASGYDPADAEKLIQHGVWLGTSDLSEQTVADIQEYRRERDARSDEEAHPVEDLKQSL